MNDEQNNIEPLQIDENPSASDVNETNTRIQSMKWYLNWKTWLKIGIGTGILTFIVVAIVFNKTTGKYLTLFLEWMQTHPVEGSFAFIGVYWFCTVLFIPGSLLTLGAGFVFREVAGPWAGIFLATAVVIIGAGLGASTAFLLGRFVFRAKVESYKAKYPKFEIVDKVVEQQGLKVTILLRLSPIIPFSAFNYFMGLSGVTFRDYNIAHVGMIPGTIAYCFIGGTLGAIGESVGFGDDPLVLIITIAGTVLAIVGMIYISWIAKREFNKLAEQHSQQQRENGEEKNENEISKEIGSPYAPVKQNDSENEIS